MSWNIEKPGDRINGPVTITGNTTLTGTATISGDLTVDTSTLKVDAANNRVGVGTASPSTTFDVVGDAKVSGGLVIDTTSLVVDAANNRVGIGTATPNATVSIKQTGAQMDVSTSATDVTFECIDRAATTNAINTRWYTRNGEFQWNNSSYSRAMTLDSSGRLGIGTAPSESLDVNGAIYVRGANALKLDNASNNYVAQIKNTGASGQSSLEFLLGSPYGTAMTLNNSGNLGLGVTPKTWGSYFKVLQQGEYAAFGHLIQSASAFITSNAYNDNNTDWKYLYGSVAASRYDASLGKHIWYNAAGGTANQVFTWTQAMTLDASGRLGIGTATVDGKVHIYGDTYANSQVRIQRNGAVNGTFSIGVAGSNNTLYIQDEVNSTARLVIDASGNLIVGTTGGSFRGLFQVQSGSNRDLFGAQVAGASNGFTIKWNHSTTTLRVNIQNLPTSASGLSSGDIWIDTTAGNVLKIA